MRRINLLLAAAGAALPVVSVRAADIAAPANPQLAPAVRIEADGGPIDITDIGHAAPFLGDVDGDGKRDLLVGQFGGGKLRIYKNTGTDAEPRFAKYEFMKAGADLGVVPAG